jgi:hypothetical protein
MVKPLDEGRWLTCVEPLLMLDWLREIDQPSSPRKLRLFGCACCRSVERRITLPPCRLAVGVAERFADGLVDSRELDRAARAAHSAVLSAANGAGGYSNRLAANFAAAQSAAPDARFAAQLACAYAFASAKIRGLPPSPVEHRTQCGLVRCLFGNPFQSPPPVEAAWLTWNGATVARMAELIYQERAWDDLPILADALEDAGCTDGDWLGHLREPGPHARGCHVLDALLGRA